ncbi:hypothetical protein BH23GEM10_BH23GEM10_01140 [soil metagenome]
MKWWIGAVFGFFVAAALIAAIALGARRSDDRSRTAADSSQGAAAVCTVVLPPTPLPLQVRETSGLADGPAGTLWTHNDAGGKAELFAFDRSGRPVAHVTVANAGFVDWEDIESGPCAEGRCLFIGDIGDNEETRSHVTIYRVPEPQPGTREVEARAIHARYPDRPQDAESLFAVDGSMYIITKGEHGPVRLYLLPPDAADGDTAVLQLVRELAPQTNDRADRVTAATASPDGDVIAFRTYSTLYFFDAATLLGTGAADSRAFFDLRSLNEPQGEGLALDANGGVWLSSEAGAGAPLLTGLACRYAGNS